MPVPVRKMTLCSCLTLRPLSRSCRAPSVSAFYGGTPPYSTTGPVKAPGRHGPHFFEMRNYGARPHQKTLAPVKTHNSGKSGGVCVRPDLLFQCRSCRAASAFQKLTGAPLHPTRHPPVNDEKGDFRALSGSRDYGGAPLHSTPAPVKAEKTAVSPPQPPQKQNLL